MGKAKSDKAASQPTKKSADDAGKDAGGSRNDVSLSEPASIDRIRDILFGSQMQEYEKKFARLEERMARELNELREEIKRSYDSLEDYFHKEVESLDERLVTEQDARTESINSLSGDIKGTNASFEKQMGKLNEQLTKTSRDLRQKILDQSKSLSDEIRQGNEETAAALEQMIQELRADKMDRSSLSELLMEMAVRLSNVKNIGLDLGTDSSKDE